MLTCQLKGGLGNQLFQIATTFSTAKDNNLKCIFDLNNHILSHQGQSAFSYKNNLFNNLPTEENLNLDRFQIYKESSFSFTQIPKISTHHNVILNGYFQSEKYFLHNRIDLLNLLNLNHNFNLPKNKTTCSIHIRRGDYLKFPDVHPICALDYYDRAISLFNPETQFFVLSDDINWCKTNLNNRGFIFMNNLQDYESLILMSLCDHNIIANSSFSWWGAWLNNNKNKKVVSPKRWFSNQISTIDLIPENWIAI